MLTDYQQILFVADTATLSTKRRQDAKQIFVFSIGIFEWLASGTANGTTIFAASGGGFWSRKVDGTPVGGGGGGQASIQFKDEGIALGSAGAITEINYVGSGILAAVTGTVLTITVGGGGGGGDPTQITITTAVSIDTTTTAAGVTQNGKNVIIDNGANAINYTMNGTITASFFKLGSGVITFVAGSGRTVVQMNATLLLNGIVGSTAAIVSVGTVDYLYISNY